jgi:hypothetical protein
MDDGYQSLRLAEAALLSVEQKRTVFVSEIVALSADKEPI